MIASKVIKNKKRVEGLTVLLAQLGFGFEENADVDQSWGG